MRNNLSLHIDRTIQALRPIGTMPIKPIEGMLRRTLVLDLSIAGGLGTTFGYLWWYGFHLPRVRARDQFYAKLEDDRAKAAGFK